jgi:hypothetical protein
MKSIIELRALSPDSEDGVEMSKSPKLILLAAGGLVGALISSRW